MVFGGMHSLLRQEIIDYSILNITDSMANFHNSKKVVFAQKTV